jgi:hypothetical protein
MRFCQDLRIRHGQAPFQNGSFHIAAFHGGGIRKGAIKKVLHQ